MNLDFTFFFNSILLGIGLAMDAFSVSLANGMREPEMTKRRMSRIAAVFSIFQFAMPLIGWECVCTIVYYFQMFETWIPWVALILLGFIGGKMLYEGRKEEDGEEENVEVGTAVLCIQGIATSIDALSVGFTISNYSFIEALFSCFLIGMVTFVICFAGLRIGKKAGTKLSGKAGILGGAILIFIGIEIFLSNTNFIS